MMNKLKALKLLIVGVRIALGLLFVYGGVQKFIPKPPRPQTSEIQEVPEHIVKIKAFIGGMKQTGYFWEFLGIAEILCGILLLSQVFSLLGAVMMVPLTLNIFFFHLFLEPHEMGELFLTGLYLVGNLFLIGIDYPKLKSTFLTYKLTT